NLIRRVENLSKRVSCRETGQTQLGHERLPVFLSEILQLQLEPSGSLDGRWGQSQTLRQERLADPRIADVDQSQLRVQCEKLETADGFLLVRFEVQPRCRLPLLHRASNSSQDV